MRYHESWPQSWHQRLRRSHSARFSTQVICNWSNFTQSGTREDEMRHWIWPLLQWMSAHRFSKFQTNRVPNHPVWGWWMPSVTLAAGGGTTYFEITHKSYSIIPHGGHLPFDTSVPLYGAVLNKLPVTLNRRRWPNFESRTILRGFYAVNMHPVSKTKLQTIN